MKISFITDEFTQSLDEAIAFAAENGLQGLELRSVDDRALQDFTLDEVRLWKRKMDRAGLETANLSSSFFKCDFDGEQIAVQLRRLCKLCEIADVLDCGMIRGFVFFRDETRTPERDALMNAFSEATAILERYDKTLVLEADPSVTTSNHRTLAEFIRELGSDRVRAVYDAGNCLFDPLREIPYPDGYEAVKPYLRHVHIKDAVYVDGEPMCLAPGAGLVDYPAVLARLKQDGYDGYLSLEPHYRKDLVLTEAQMRTPAGADFSKGGREAMQESVDALKKILSDLCWFPTENR